MNNKDFDFPEKDWKYISSRKLHTKRGISMTINITINRDRAKILVGYSSKILQVIMLNNPLS